LQGYIENLSQTDYPPTTETTPGMLGASGRQPALGQVRDLKPDNMRGIVGISSMPKAAHFSVDSTDGVYSRKCDALRKEASEGLK